MILISPLAFPRLRSLQTKRPPKYFQKHYVREIWKGNKICAKIYLLPIGLTFNHFWSHPVGSPWYLRETIVSYHVHRIHGNLSNVWGTQYQFHSPPAKVFLIRSPSSPFTLAANPKSVTFTRPSWSARLKLCSTHFVFISQTFQLPLLTRHCQIWCLCGQLRARGGRRCPIM